MQIFSYFKFQQLQRSRELRRAYMQRLFKHLTLRMRVQFVKLMDIKKFSADIEISAQEKTLNLVIVPRDSQKAHTMKSAKALSGGERSFSTVAFLLSLWRCVSHPFYFMDEYDVFSDEHNRHMMTELLFNEARNHPERQYGFLTPQDFSNIEASETISIHKMSDPDRRR